MSSNEVLARDLHDTLYIDWEERVSGWGVYTREKIQGDSLVEVCPVVVYPEDILKIAKWNAGDDPTACVHLGLPLYSLRWGEDQCAVPLGYGAIYNHSDSNNCQFVGGHEHGLLYIVSLRDIEPGEQLTVSYGETWFEGKPFPKVNL